MQSLNTPLSLDTNQTKVLWFRAKRYGYGWTPVTWQGWGIVTMYVFALVSTYMFINNHARSVSDLFIAWIPLFFILSTYLHIICEAKGEHAKWRWWK